jgi:putative peptidoglycan lipid II flippase
VVLKISLITVAINVAGSLSLMPILGHVGLAVATSVSGTMAAAIMLYLLIRQRRLSASFLPACGKTILASSVMGVAIIFLQLGLERFVMLPAAMSLTFIVAGGGAVYAVTAYVMGAVPAGLLPQSNDLNT